MSHFSLQEHIPLAPLTTLGVGGQARYFAVVKTSEELREAALYAREQSLPIFFLGGGSNIVVSDAGFNGLVIQNAIRGFSHQLDATTPDTSVLVNVGAGEKWDETVERCVREGFAGLETLSGIPGKVGGAPVQNIGAYGQSVASVIRSVEALDIETLSLRAFSHDECAFGYRDSIFKRNPNRYCISEVVFALTPGGAPNISSYPDIAAYFKDNEKIPTLLEVRNATIEIRARKGMVIRPEYESYSSVGSFFENPIVSKDVFLEARERSRKCLPTEALAKEGYWELPNGTVKLSAAYLIEQTGFTRGYRHGNTGISPKHTLAILNYGGATAEEIARFARLIRDTVMEKFGVRLTPEAQFVGFAENPLA
jgi:UDP-N-acetylmuramate dehydrogenase